MQDEKRLLKRMQKGEAEAFAEFVDRFGGRVHALARRYTRCEADAEDVTQEVFVALCKSIGNFRGESALGTWVYRVTVNICLKHQSRRPPESAPLDDLPVADAGPTPEDHAARAELSAQVEGALANLSDNHREVVVLHEMHGLTYAECAEALGVPIGTVKSRLFHAFGRLRELLGRYVRGEEEITPAARSAVR